MYKVYSRNQLIRFSPAGSGFPGQPVHLKGNETAKELNGFIEKNRPGKGQDMITFLSDDINRTWDTFCSLYIKMDAAGGIVFNNNKELLLIYRNDHWDLPKGKIEKGEDNAAAAMREVQEETGVEKLTVIAQCSNTYHIYPFKKDNILKCTYWFRMHSDYSGPLKPQIEENINIARWMNGMQVQDAMLQSYPSVADLLGSEGLIKARATS